MTAKLTLVREIETDVHVPDYILIQQGKCSQSNRN